MYEVPHELPNDQENEDILVKSRNWVNTCLAPSLPGCTLWKSVGPTTDLKTQKNVVYDKPYDLKAFNEIFLLENRI